jgi:hypothetical protein
MKYGRKVAFIVDPRVEAGADDMSASVKPTSLSGRYSTGDRVVVLMVVSFRVR